jgi:hypothetical protein
LHTDAPILLTLAQVRREVVDVDRKTILDWEAAGQFPPAVLEQGVRRKVRLYRREQIERWARGERWG